jgi:hypothetical protein
MAVEPMPEGELHRALLDHADDREELTDSRAAGWVPALVAEARRARLAHADEQMAVGALQRDVARLEAERDELRAKEAALDALEAWLHMDVMRVIVPCGREYVALKPKASGDDPEMLIAARAGGFLALGTALAAQAAAGEQTEEVADHGSSSSPDDGPAG